MQNNDVQFIVVEPGGDITRAMLADLEKSDDVTILDKPYIIKNNFLKKLKTLHFSNKLNSVINIPGKSMWNRYSTVHNFPFVDNVKYFVIFNNSSISEYSPELIRKLGKKKNIELVLYFSDPVDAFVAQKAKKIAQQVSFKHIFSFDPDDCKKYNYTYINALYSKKEFEKVDEISNDLYFVGENKGRLPILNTIYDNAKKNNASPYFRIQRVPDEECDRKDIIYNKRIPYLATLEELQYANCILDIVQEGQSGVTLRYYEAICYNKKLLTNSTTVKSMPYYNPKYMQVFRNVEDIDWDWVKDDSPVDYEYKNDFSPVRFIEKIKSM
ncbi:MAG: hypothetical protein ACI4RL_00240 [Ruminococcus sp.]